MNNELYPISFYKKPNEHLASQNLSYHSSIGLLITSSK